jgi:Ca2+-transporting ATPase
VFPALALGVSEGDTSVMRHKPRDRNEAILTRSHWFAITGYSVMITLSVFGAFASANFWLGMSISRTITISFLTLALAQLWHVFNMRDSGSKFFRNDIIRSPYIWGALFLCLGLLIIAIYVPFLANLLKLEALGFLGWGLAIGFSIIPLIIGQFLKQVRIQEATS